MSKLCPISHFLSPVSWDSLVLQGLRCEWGAGVLTLSLFHTGHWKFNMAPHGKELSEDLKKRIIALHKDGVGYKKIAKTLKLICSTVAKTIQRFYQDRFHSEQASPWSMKKEEVFKHDYDPKHTSEMTTALLKKPRVKVICGASSNERWRSTRSLTFTSSVRDVIMEEWKRTPVAALWSSGELWRVKPVLENNSGHTKYWHFVPNLDIFT